MLVLIQEMVYRQYTLSYDYVTLHKRLFPCLSYLEDEFNEVSGDCSDGVDATIN